MPPHGSTPREPRATVVWQPAAEAPGHPLAALERATIGEDVALAVELGPRNAVGASYFRLYLLAGGGMAGGERSIRSMEPVLTGMHNSGPQPGFNWVEVIAYRDRLYLTAERAVEVPAGIERRIFERLASLVPPGGHLMVEYDSPSRTTTARALAARVPPPATPLGALLVSVGCGASFRDWYISEGGREGPRKLQGFRALDAAHEQQRASERLPVLEAFLDGAAGLDWGVQAVCRPLAQAEITRLRRQPGSSEEDGGS